MTPIARSSTPREHTRPDIGWCHGAFDRFGRWVPNAEFDPRSLQITKDVIWVRRHHVLSPAGFLERLARYQFAADAAKMLGSDFLGRLSHFDQPDGWPLVQALDDTDFSHWLVRCGCPAQDHEWDKKTCCYWVPMRGNPIWDKRAHW